MKQIVIGDIHGRNIWRDILKKHSDADRIIFIGDYVDTHEDISGARQLHELEGIIALKKESRKEVILLVGNHDHHYWPGVGYTGTSGYQPKMAPSFEICFKENSKLFQMCFVDENKTVYSHAGFSDKFLRSINVYGTTKFDEINEIFFTRPKTFCFYEGDFSGYGQHPLQSCIWIRPESLYNNAIDQLQVIGHTSVNKINHPPKSERRGFYMIDALAHGQYLSCTDGEFKVEQIEK